jgi:hypothetical protein
MGFLDKGSFIRHRNLGFIVRINDVKDGIYTLGWTVPPETNSLDPYLLRGAWTASDLVRHFTPHVLESRWDRVLDGSLLSGTPLGEI